MTRRLSARPHIEDKEDIAAFLERCAVANGLEFAELTGHQRTSRVWEKPPSTASNASNDSWWPKSRPCGQTGRP